MQKISDMYKRQIVSTDGRVLGTLKGVSVMDDWSVKGLTVKIDNDAVDDLGKKKPFLGTLRLDVGVDNVTAMGDNIVLNKSLKDMGALLADYRENNDSFKLVKMAVIDSEGKDIGWVSDVMMDDAKWNVPSLLVKMNNETSEIMKAKKPGLSNPEVSLPTAHISATGDRVMLSVTVAELSKVLERAPDEKA